MRGAWTSWSGHPAVTTELLRLGADANVADNRSPPALAWAATKGHAGCVRALLAAPGTKVDIVDARGYTPLWSARRFGCADVVALLEAAGAR